MDSPSDAFKEVFEEYGAKLSPELMRLQIEGGDLPFADGPDEDVQVIGSPTRKAVEEKSDDEASDREEEEFLATQRQQQRKASNPGSGHVSKQNSSGPGSSANRKSRIILGNGGDKS